MPITLIANSYAYTIPLSGFDLILLLFAEVTNESLYNVDFVTDVNRDDWSNSHGIGVMEFTLKLSVTEIPSINKIEQEKTFICNK